MEVSGGIFSRPPSEYVCALEVTISQSFSEGLPRHSSITTWLLSPSDLISLDEFVFNTTRKHTRPGGRYDDENGKKHCKAFGVAVYTSIWYSSVSDLLSRRITPGISFGKKPPPPPNTSCCQPYQPRYISSTA